MNYESPKNDRLLHMLKKVRYILQKFVSFYKSSLHYNPSKSTRCTDFNFGDDDCSTFVAKTVVIAWHRDESSCDRVENVLKTYVGS